MAITRRTVEIFAENHEIELEITEFSRNKLIHGRAAINHVHAYTKTGEVFGSSDLHNLSIWDCDSAEKIDWTQVMAELLDHMPVPCPFMLENGGTGCEVCDEETFEVFDAVEGESHDGGDEEESHDGEYGMPYNDR